MNVLHVSLLSAFAATSIAAQTQPPAPTPAPAATRPAPPRPTRHQIWAGDLNNDRKSEIITWDDKSNLLVIRDGVTGAELTSLTMTSYPGAIKIADADGDGRNDLVIGEGLAGYNPKTGPQTPVRIRIYHPLEASAWAPTEIFTAESERPEITSLDVTNLDTDAPAEILFSHMASKYQTAIARADRTGSAWKVTPLDDIRMGMNVTSGDVMRSGTPALVVGRPYGDPVDGSTAVIGDAFIVQSGKRVSLPVYRGVSDVATGDVDMDRRPGMMWQTTPDL